MKKYTSLLLLFVLFIGITSCSDKNSLHNYFVDHAEKTGFFSTTLPVSLLRNEALQLTTKQKEAVDAIEHINLLFYKYDAAKEAEFSTERSTISSILKSEKYQELINLGTNGIIKYIGTDDAMDEIVVFLANKDNGFAVTRIIGDNMTLEKFMELYKLTQQKDVPLNFNLGSITNMFSNN
ncbi:uncharacterized protein DUF4252 [Kordia periserrulae]|uniref:Uncharacterized protein DUF4252 n=1 Tax=Kordia periserrulae TaxID=701523 RepID=A0A2T6C3J6_9FLAO|nr:DUF4252 domain-containing protein [Kordia periserrulae]PTX62899.1 uncharacterized protein DUF4252 [Kordia periserrulae]